MQKQRFHKTDLQGEPRSLVALDKQGPAYIYISNNPYGQPRHRAYAEIWYSLGHGVVCLFFLIGTVRCVHCSIHLGSFWSPLGVILVTLGSILVALGSILVALGSPGDPRGTL